MKSNANILLVEDDQTFCKTIISALNKEGYHVDTANNDKEALALIQTKQYDLVISDVRLPGSIDGVEIVRKIKQSSVNEISSIIMTGYADEDASIRAIDVKVDSYIKKPFEIRILLNKIKENLLVLEEKRKDEEYLKGIKNIQKKHEEWGQENSSLKNDLCDLIVEILCVNKIEIKKESNFRADLGADSIDMAELMTAIEQRFRIEIKEDKVKEIETVGEAFDWIKSTQREKIQPTE